MSRVASHTGQIRRALLCLSKLYLEVRYGRGVPDRDSQIPQSSTEYFHFHRVICVTYSSEGMKLVMTTLGDGPERRAYDTLTGVIYSLQTSDHFREMLKKELDTLYEAWYQLKLEEGSGR